MLQNSIDEPARLLPPPNLLRQRLAKALRDADILRGLLKLAEGVARRDGHPAEDVPSTPTTAPRPEVGRE